MIPNHSNQTVPQSGKEAGHQRGELEKLNRVYSIYKITNKINGKIYIGRTMNHLSIRFNSHKSKALGITRLLHQGKGQSGCRYLANAIRKHGGENFAIEPIEVCPTFDEMKQREGELIKQYNSCNPLIGYNLRYETSKGENFLSQESRDLQSAKCHLNQFLQKRGPLGVFKIKGKNSWRSEFICRNIEFYKNFDTKDKAIEWYDKLCLYYRGLDTPLNKPEKRYEYISSGIGKMVEEMERARLERQARYSEIISTPTGYRCFFKGKSYGVYKTELEAVETRDKIAIYHNEVSGIVFPEKVERYKLAEKETQEIIKFYTDSNKPFANSKYGLHNVKASRSYKDKIYWSYRFAINGKMEAEGGFKTKESASLARDIGFLNKKGYYEKIKLNFPIASIFLFESGKGLDIIQSLKTLQPKELNVFRHN